MCALVIPREGVERKLLIDYVHVSAVLVIPREGVESVVNYYITVRVGTHHVIPREGVESSILISHAIKRQQLVIPREGVESNKNVSRPQQLVVVCDPERGS